MAIVYTFSSQAALTGAIKFNRVHRIAAQEDVGFKLERLISQVNDMRSAISLVTSAVSFLNSAVIQINSAISAAVAASQVSGLSYAYFSATSFGSTATLSLTATLSNFSDA